MKGASRRLSPAPSRSSECPCLDTATGSTTSGAGTAPTTSATTPTMPLEASIPVLTAWTGMSVRIEYSCSRTASGGRSQKFCTPTEFCAVTAVTTLIPCTPRACMVLRSAWMPAPPQESDPAMVSTHGGVGGNGGRDMAPTI